ncbi:hypothetical protein KOW79_009931 [Hemibagrus wyckioides]|uniref:Uncharacterized protein n=1 Tax=Hemibagrus wyckioides TaxID=337641 RepID=A0A9D3NQE7_9TELE|nr:uncharacterized protein si:ch211-286o17.1 [Hemibagrus wyckioides]KAG7326530.1 hypothetical protein KOW79_009931 [Hemibagrus wyckioides]
MKVFNWKKTNTHTFMALASVVYAIIFGGVTCHENAITHTILSNSTGSSLMGNVRGDNILTTPAASGLKKTQGFVSFPEINDMFPTMESTKSNTGIVLTTVNHLQTSNVECVDEAAVRDKGAVKLMLETFSSCEENKAKIQSILEHLCGDDRKLEIYQKDHSKEMIISGECVEGDVKGMTDKFDNDNIKHKVGVVEAEPVLVNHSPTVLISVLIAGLLLAALLILAYILKTRRTEAKGARLAEELFQVDEQNQGNTLLSVAPLPPQEPVEKPTTNGESLDSPPTNGHSASQTPVADSEM